ncbi:hypothetical protein ACI8AV_13180 [Geodermatophilus sp. SYSU D00804]
MTDNDTRAVMEAYIQALVKAAEFERFFAPDVVWTTMETGQETHGRQAVRDLIIGLHTQVFDAHPASEHLRSCRSAHSSQGP